MLTKYRSVEVTLNKKSAEVLIGYLYIQIEELQLKYLSGEMANVIDDIDPEEDEFEPWDDDMSF
jgi:hypothetical protein